MTADRAITSDPWWRDDRMWLVGVDGSEPAHTALEWAIANAPDRATSMRVVTAWQPPILSPGLYGGAVTLPYDTEPIEEAAREDIQRTADEAQRRLDIPVDGVVRCGGASTALLDESTDAVLLVLGTRGRGGFSRLLLGSTSSQCATHAEVPTVVVHDGWEGDTTGRVLVGVDGSPNSLTALDWSLRFARPGATIEVTWVWDTSPLAVGADEFFFPDAGETAELRFHHLVDMVMAHRDVSQLTVERTFRRGRPREDLAMAAESVDLVVMGARGHGAVGAALLGSVSSWLLHRLHRPMVVVPHVDETGTPTTSADAETHVA